MTPEEINIAIAESCGWDARWAHYGNSPNYYKDLNAIHGVVRQLGPDTKFSAISVLADLVGAWINRPEVVENEEVEKAKQAVKIALATPALWCEAYLKAIGKWKGRA